MHKTGGDEVSVIMGTGRVSASPPPKIRQEIQDVGRISRVPNAMTKNSSIRGGVVGSGL